MLKLTPFPYQGSKRKIAGKILSFFPEDVETLIEPFCGASAVSILAAKERKAQKIILNDLNEPLIELWEQILSNHQELSNSYKELWYEQLDNPKEFFIVKRDEFNKTKSPHLLLYLLARIVKGAVRYNRDGEFNQSADNRRKGMKPERMKRNLEQISFLLSDITTTLSKDYKEVVTLASKKDLIYLDPPYQGTSFTRDHRYFEGVKYDEFVTSLQLLNKNNLSYIISYDGTCGQKEYGQKLPDNLNLEHFYINAGRSTQSTLLGRSDSTFESLYLSPALIERLKCESSQKNMPISEQIELALNEA
jgi:DNA adenine methylase